MTTNSDHTMDDTSNPSINKPENISLKNNETYNPTEPIIATMTLISNINANINLLNFSKYLTLSQDGIVYVKYNKDNNLIERSLEKNNNKPKKRKKPKKYFYNQCTIIINVGDKTVNLKLFLNGKIQMTGCKSLENAKLALEKMSIELKKEKYVLVNDTILEKEIIDNTDFIIDDPHIELINSVFQTGISIDRDKLHQILVNQYHMQATYQPVIYVGINSKFIAKSGTKVSILIFQTGKIIITAAKTLDDITDSYEFMKKVFYENKDVIQR